MSEGFGWVRVQRIISTGWAQNPAPSKRSYWLEVQYKTGEKEKCVFTSPETWYDNGPYTVMRWRPSI